MKVIKYENVVGCDIDDTILMWDNPTVPGIGKVEMEFAGKKVFLTPHTYHIDLLKMYLERGYYIIFWSGNGWQHAERAIKVLGLEELADGEHGHVQVKLTKHMDDSEDPKSILGPRVYCEDLTKPTTYFIENPPKGYKVIKF